MIERLQRNLPSVVGVVLALGAAIVVRQAMHPILAPLEAEARILYQLGIKWMITFILLGIVLIWEREPLRSIGIRPMNRSDFFWALVGFLIGGAIISGTIPLLKSFGLGTTEAGVRRLGEFSFTLRILMVLTAAVTEEIQYRGYPIERLFRLTGNLPLSAAITYVVFVCLHISFWTLGGAIQIGLGALVLYALYLWRRNLPACMVMHGLNNSVAFLLIPELLGSNLAQPR